VLPGAALLVGVQVGTSLNRRVTVGVGGKNAGFNVDGGNGLRLVLGFKKIMTK
jgi:hypothetical protein